MYRLIIDKFQIGYEHLLDNYGIMKGTLMLILISVSFLADLSSQLATKQIYVINTIATLMLVWQSISYRAQQIQGNYTKINKMAEAHRTYPIAVGMVLIFLLYLVWSSINNPAWEGVRFERFLVNAPLVPYLILISVYVRDSESRRETKFVFNGA